MKRILITGGPVHAHLDAVKIITNKFKGGLMTRLAKELVTRGDIRVSYICSKMAEKPELNPATSIYYHEGFEHYKESVLKFAPEHDAVILGAAVANLIPYKPIQGKFPSHNYKPGDLVPLIFQIAPRVIDEVKKAAPNTHLFGFKLLSDVSHEELIDAAYGVLLESKATAIFANDSTDLETIYVVCKDRSEHKIQREELSDWIIKFVNDVYYKTVGKQEKYPEDYLCAVNRFNDMAAYEKNMNNFKKNKEGYVFGTIAVRASKGFVTTTRGKKDIKETVYVSGVDHTKQEVYVGNQKATLNAPLLDWVFSINPRVHTIVHLHKCIDMFRTLPYAPPGTVRDSVRDSRDISKSFNIANHGSYFLYDEEGAGIL